MSVYKEIWTGELLKRFRHLHLWLARIAGRDDLVNNNVIHMVDVGADPAVLINNTTYPINVVGRTDDDVAISLDKFDTENTKVTDDELHAISYDKIGSVVEQHGEVLEETTAEKALHALTPASNSTDTPVIPTTGADRGDGTKRMVPADLITMKRKFDDLKIPKKNRLAVLSNEHIEDLLLVDEKFRDQYKNLKTGEVLPMYGWEIFESPYNPVFDGTNTKKAFGAAAAGTDRNASVFFYAPRAFKAKGDVKMYHGKAEDDPQNRQTVVGFRLWFICLPKKWKGFGAIRTANV